MAREKRPEKHAYVLRGRFIGYDNMNLLFREQMHCHGSLQSEQSGSVTSYRDA